MDSRRPAGPPQLAEVPGLCNPDASGSGAGDAAGSAPTGLLRQHRVWAARSPRSQRRFSGLRRLLDLGRIYRLLMRPRRLGIYRTQLAGGRGS